MPSPDDRPNLDAIEARAAIVALRHPGDDGCPTCQLTMHDVPELAAELRRLRAQVAELDAARAAALEDNEAAEALTVAMARADTAEARVAELKNAILDIDAHATPYGVRPEDPDGNPAAYLVTVGALHRAIGKVGHTAAPYHVVLARMVAAEAAVREAISLLGPEPCTCPPAGSCSHGCEGERAEVAEALAVLRRALGTTGTPAELLAPDEAVRAAVGNARLAGYKPTADEIARLRQITRGERTADEVVAEILAPYRHATPDDASAPGECQ